MAPLFEHYGIQLWMPEAGGRVDYAPEHDERAMTVLGLRLWGITVSEPESQLTYMIPIVLATKFSVATGAVSNQQGLPLRET